jgi:hypothetical protein
VIVFFSIRILGTRDSWFAWVTLIVFFVWASGSAGMLARGRVQLIIDRDGIHDLRRDIGILRWADMKGIFARRIGNRELLCFSFRDPASFSRRLPAFDRKLSEVLPAQDLGDFRTDVTRLGIDIEEVVEFASKRIAESG